MIAALEAVGFLAWSYRFSARRILAALVATN